MKQLFLALWFTLSVLNPVWAATETKTDAKYAPYLRVAKSFVKNPDCELSTTSGITSSAGTLTRQTSSPLVTGAGAHCRWNPGTSGATLKFDIDTLSPNVAAGNCDAFFTTDVTTAGQYSAYLEYDGVAVTSEIPVDATVKGQEFSIPATYCGSSVTTRKLVIKSLVSPSPLNIGGVNYNKSSLMAGYSVKAPTTQEFLSTGSGVYTTPAGVLYIRIRMVGGGGGGAGSATNNPGTAGSGTASLWKTADGVTTLLTANGGNGAAPQNGQGGLGGTASIGTGPIGFAVQGAPGGPGFYTGSTNITQGGGQGASTIFGPGGRSSNFGAFGHAAEPNSGGGGSGASIATGTTNGYGGAGGGAGGYVDAIIKSPATSYQFIVGSGGTPGPAGTSGAVGGGGATGRIIVDEFYQ